MRPRTTARTRSISEADACDGDPLHSLSTVHLTKSQGSGGKLALHAVPAIVLYDSTRTRARSRSARIILVGATKILLGELHADPESQTIGKLEQKKALLHKTPEGRGHWKTISWSTTDKTFGSGIPVSILGCFQTAIKEALRLLPFRIPAALSPVVPEDQTVLVM